MKQPTTAVRNLRFLNLVMVSLFATFAAVFVITAQLIAGTAAFRPAAATVMYFFAGACGVGVLLCAVAGYRLGMLGRELRAVNTDDDTTTL